jgi:hypothetical protein
MLCWRGLSKGSYKALCISQYKAMGMWEYRHGNKKPKRKSPKMSRLKIQSQVVIRGEIVEVEVKILGIIVCNG